MAGHADRSDDCIKVLLRTCRGPPAARCEKEAVDLWGTDDAVRRRFRLGAAEGPASEVIGIAEDARFRNLTTDLSAARVEPDVYVPFAQRPDVDIEIALRTQAAGLSIVDLQRATTAVDASLPLYRVRQLQDAVREQTSTARFGSALLTAFSGGALLLAESRETLNARQTVD